MNYKVIIASIGIALGSVCSAYAGVKEDLVRLTKLQETINGWRNNAYDQGTVNERNSLGKKYEALIFSQKGKTYTGKLASALLSTTPENAAIEQKELEDLITIQSEINAISKDADSEIPQELVEERDLIVDQYNVNDAPGNTVVQKARYVISQLPKDELQKTSAGSPSNDSPQQARESKNYASTPTPNPKQDETEMKLSSSLQEKALPSQSSLLQRETPLAFDSPYQQQVKQMLAREFPNHSIDTLLQTMEHQELYVKSGKGLIKVEGVKLDKRGLKGKVSPPRDTQGNVKKGYKAINGFTVALSYQHVRDAFFDPMRGRIEYELLKRKESRNKGWTKPRGKDLLYNGTPLRTIVEQLSANYIPDKRFEKIVENNYSRFREKIFEKDITPQVTNFVKNSLTLALQKREYVAIGTKGLFPTLGLFDGKKGVMVSITLASAGRKLGDKITTGDHRYSSLAGLDMLKLGAGNIIQDGLFTGHTEIGVAGDAIHSQSWMNRFIGKNAQDILQERKNLRTSKGCFVIPTGSYARIRKIAKENNGIILAAFAPEPELPLGKRQTD